MTEINQPSRLFLIIACSGIMLPTLGAQSPLESIDLGCSFR